MFTTPLESADFFTALQASGVGKRQLSDPYFHGNDVLAPLTKRLGIYDDEDEELCDEFVRMSCHIPGCIETFETILDFESHYNAVHRFPCGVCKKQLPSAHLLDLHLQEMHDSFFAAMSMKKPSFCCYVEECKLKFANADERRTHCITEHKFPHEFRYDVPSKGKKKSRNSKQKQAADTAMDITSSNIDCPSQSIVKPEAGEPADARATNPILKNFSFGHTKTRGFTKYGGKLFTNDRKNTTDKPTVLNSDTVMTDLKDNLPEV